MSKPLRLLVSGDVRGRFEQLFTRVSAIQKKSGAFDLLFCVGDFFGDDNDNPEWEQLVAGTIKVPVVTLVLGPNKDKHSKFFSGIQDGVLCENITYLGRSGLYRGSSDLTVVYLSGVEQTTSKNSSDQDNSCFTADDVETLLQSITSKSNFQGVDLLLTSQWPQNVDKYGTRLEDVDTKSRGSALITQLALTVRPRYHFCSLEGVSYERQPYRNHKIIQENARHVTRFIGLADVGNEHKRKYLYAVNVVPLKHMDEAELTKQPPDVTECPYKVDSSIFKKTKSQQGSKPAQFFYDADVIERGTTLSSRGKRKSQGTLRDGPQPPKKHPQPTGPCWFCLASPEVEKHLVISVGTQCYLALAKGALTSEHVLILPIGHYQSTISAPDDVIDEIEKFKSALKKCFSKAGKSVVFYERNYKTQHLQIQVIPVAAESSDVLEAFMDCAQRLNVELNELPAYSDIKQIVPPGAPYFYAELPGSCKMLCRISKGFPIQFGREALVHRQVLNMQDRADWKSCQLSKNAEIDMVAKFRETFKNYDFTLE